jgi:tetratricopeptide (TPR) repeat protein
MKLPRAMSCRRASILHDESDMDTDAHLVTVSESPAHVTGRSSLELDSAPTGRFLVIKVLVILLSLGLFAFSLWWIWRDTRPLADLKTIGAWIAREQFAQAESALREWLRREPHDGEARMLLAKALAGRGDLLGCSQQLHQVPAWWPKKPEAQFREGQAYLMINRAKDAEAAWLSVVEDDPLHPRPSTIFHDASLELLKLYSTEDRWEDAYVILWRAYELASPVDRLNLLSMRLRSELERVAHEESIVRLERYVAADSTDWEALRALARAELTLGRPAEASRHFQQCLKGQPENPRCWRDYLNMLHEQGERDALMAELAKVPQVAESEPEIWKIRGMMAERASDWTGAAQDYRMALERNPFVTAYHYRLAMVEERLGHREQAAEHRRKAEELRVAREHLSTAFSDLLTAREHRDSHNPQLKLAIERLASVCETLGWGRLAEAWKELAKSP